MKLQKIYSALLTTDLTAAESWYTKLLGRGPDYRPMETLIQWDLFAQGGLQLATDDNLAGNGALFLLVGDIATERQRLRDLGISLGDDIQGTYAGAGARPRRQPGHLSDAAIASIPAGMTRRINRS